MKGLKIKGFIIILIGMGMLIWNLYLSFRDGKGLAYYTTIGSCITAIGIVQIKRDLQKK